MMRPSPKSGPAERDALEGAGNGVEWVEKAVDERWANKGRKQGAGKGGLVRVWIIPMQLIVSKANSMFWLRRLKKWMTRWTSRV